VARPATHAVPDAVAPPPRHPRFALIDGVRAIAALSIVVSHVWGPSGIPGDSLTVRLLSYTNIGVPIFFVISGFLLYRPFIAHRAGGTDAPATGDYAKRRALRIFPGYWFVLTVLTVLPGVTGVWNGQWLAQYGLVFTFWTPNCTLSSCAMGQTWSLVVELTFYICLPLFAFAANRLAAGRSLRRSTAVELALLAGLSVASILIFRANAVSSWTGQTVAASFFWFALGMGLALASVNAGTSVDRGPARFVADHATAIWAAAFTLYVVMCLTVSPDQFFLDRAQSVWSHVAMGLVAFCLVAPAIFARTTTLPSRFLANRVVAWLGLVSYGIFLWHFAWVTWLAGHISGITFWPLLAVTLAGTIACAAISYYAIERPFLRLKYQRLRDLARRRQAA
jgi:peptidoglycan/LPS O-acetylase OafA/YrhL